MPNNVRCRMQVQGKQALEGSEDMTRVTLAVPTNATGEQAMFGRYTPFGRFEAVMVTSSADNFVEGEFYYIDISPVGAEPETKEEDSE